MTSCRMRGCSERHDSETQEATKLVILRMSYGDKDRKSFLCDDCYKLFVQVKYAFELGRVDTYTPEVPYKIIDTFS